MTACINSSEVSGAGLTNNLTCDSEQNAYCRITGVGGYLPEKIITNHDLEKTLDTSHDWIVTRTGIHQRHQAAKNQNTSDLAVRAAQSALDHAGLQGQDIDLIILATTTPDHTFPATAVKVQNALGARGYAFDVQAVCAGFVFALATADSHLKAGLANKALVIGAETMSRIVDWTDRSTAILFGDGAGAVVLEKTKKLATHTDRNSDTETVADGDSGMVAHQLFTDGSCYDSLWVKGGVSCGALGTIYMDGQTVFKRAIKELSDVSRHILQKASKQLSQVDWVVPHQANQRILTMVSRNLSLPMDKMILTLDKHANTSAASVPLALWEGVHSGKIQKGQLVLTNAFAAGFAWGGNLFRF